MSKHKKIPKFNNFSEEEKFWSENESTNYIDWGKAKKVICLSLKPTSFILPQTNLLSIKGG